MILKIGSVVQVSVIFGWEKPSYNRSTLEIWLPTPVTITPWSSITIIANEEQILQNTRKQKWSY